MSMKKKLVEVLHQVEIAIMAYSISLNVITSSMADIAEASLTFSLYHTYLNSFPQPRNLKTQGHLCTRRVSLLKRRRCSQK